MTAASSNGGGSASTIRWEQDSDGVVVLTLDDPSSSANTMNEAFMTSFRETIDRLEAEKDEIKGVVITSAKSTFFAGANLHDLRQARKEDADQVAEMIRTIKSLLRRLETLGKPVVAAINGAALGGGLEICLASHHRVIVDDPKAVVGFPEVQLGLLPGAGGVVRTVRMLGIVGALMQVLLQGQRHRPAKAKELGLVDEIVPAREDLVPAAKRWIEENPEAAQPWDRPAQVGGEPDSGAAEGNQDSG
jgi:3-hydroxyacyl-CoA dehydrogenase / enoyl-CoA hydratase / 3-hydroxybutyryl-CoA epimerase